MGAAALTNLKVELIRIERGEPATGPWLTADEERQLEHWSEKLCEGAMQAWASHFSGLGWPPAWGIDTNPDEDPFDVPDPFRTLVCNLVWIRLNLWPKIKVHLDKMHIRGRHMFPTELWTNPVVNLCMNEEPRCISFVADAGHIDMNALARKGPVRRSDTARRDSTLEGLTDNQKRLLRSGAQYIGDTFRKGQYLFQGTWWDASIFTWPRETLPKLEDLMETILK